MRENHLIQSGLDPHQMILAMGGALMQLKVPPTASWQGLSDSSLHLPRLETCSMAIASISNHSSDRELKIHHPVLHPHDPSTKRT